MVVGWSLPRHRCHVVRTQREKPLLDFPPMLLFSPSKLKLYGCVESSVSFLTSFAHFVLMLSLRYLVKCRSCSLVLYGNESILGSGTSLYG